MSNNQLESELANTFFLRSLISKVGRVIFVAWGMSCDWGALFLGKRMIKSHSEIRMPKYSEYGSELLNPHIMFATSCSNWVKTSNEGSSQEIVQPKLLRK